MATGRVMITGMQLVAVPIVARSGLLQGWW